MGSGWMNRRWRGFLSGLAAAAGVAAVVVGPAIYGQTQPASRPVLEVGKLREQIAALEKLPRTAETEAKIYSLQATLLGMAETTLNQNALHLAGEVVDEDGKTLENVKLAVQRNQATDLGWGKKSHTEESVISGHFQCDITGVNTARLFFGKPGYYDRELFLPLNSKDDTIKELAKLKTVTLAGGKTGVQIVMEKQGALTRLTNIDVDMEYRPNGSGLVAALASEDQTTVEVKKVADLSQMPAHAFYLVPELDEAQQIKWVHAFPDFPERGEVPVHVRIVAADKDDGLIKAWVEHGNLEHVMRHAPEKGYESSVEWKGHELFNHGQVGFYFRCNGKYGRAIVRIQISRDKAKAWLPTMFQLQPDGSRNLETGQ